MNPRKPTPVLLGVLPSPSQGPTKPSPGTDNPTSHLSQELWTLIHFLAQSQASAPYLSLCLVLLFKLFQQLPVAVKTQCTLAAKSGLLGNLISCLDLQFASNLGEDGRYSWALVLWYCGLNHYLPSWNPMSTSLSPRCSISNPVPCKCSWEECRGWSRCSGHPTHVGDSGNSRLLASAWPSPSCCSHLENDPMGGRPFSQSLFFYNSACQINK